MMIEMNVIHAAWKNFCRKLEFLGSSCIYPKFAPQPMTENFLLTSSLEPTNEAYALAKISGLKYCDYLNRQYGTDFISFMPTTLYGANDNYHPTRSHVLPALIRRFHEANVQSLPSVTCWGDGSARREFMYAGDLANCIWQAVERFDELPPLMNVGTGEDYSVDEYYQTIAQVVGYKGTFTHDLTKPAGMKRKLTDITRMKNFGWQPQTTLTDGIKLSVDFYREQIVGQGSNKIGVGWAFISDTGKRLVNEILNANRLSQGPLVRKFEKEFARLHNQKYGVALNSGTSALHVGLEALKENSSTLTPKLTTLTPRRLRRRLTATLLR